MHCHPPSTYMVAQTTTSSQIRGDNRQAAVVESKRKYSSAVVYQDLSRLAAARRFLGRPQHQGSIVSRNDACNNKNQVESQYYSLVSCKNIIRKYIMLEGQKVSLALYKYTPNGVCCCEMWYTRYHTDTIPTPRKVYFDTNHRYLICFVLFSNCLMYLFRQQWI